MKKYILLYLLILFCGSVIVTGADKWLNRLLFGEQFSWSALLTESIQLTVLVAILVVIVVGWKFRKGDFDWEEPDEIPSSQAAGYGDCLSCNANEGDGRET